MKSPAQFESRHHAFRIIFYYILFGVIWIYTSDTILGWFIKDAESLVRFAIYKGVIYIFLTSILLYALIRAYIREISLSRSEQKKLEERFINVAALSPDIISIMSEQGELLYNSPAAERIHGYQNHEMVGRSTFGFMHPEDLPNIEEKMRQLLANPEQTITVQYRYRNKDGRYIWMEASARNQIRNPLIHGLIVISRDISERKKIEEKILQQEIEFKFLIDVLPVGVGWIDFQDKIQYVNRHFVERFGYQQEDIPTLEEWFRLAYPEVKYRKTQKNIYEKVIRIAKADGKPIPPRDVMITTKSGAVKRVIVSNQISANRILAIFTDITEHEKMHEELMKLQKLESLGLLAGGIAHDFNNILTGILGNISFAKMFLEESHKSYLPLCSAEKASGRAADLAHQLLTFARGGKSVAKLVSCEKLMEEVSALASRGTNVQVKLDLSSPLMKIKADENQIHQVFNNLIINAIQAMPEGGCVHFRAENFKVTEDLVFLTGKLKPGKYVKFTIQDEGCGISSENLTKIFDPYFTTKSKGVGLGLAMVHSIVLRHRGEIQVDSVLGRGTTVTVCIPADDQQSASADLSQKSIVTPTSASGHRKSSILVMDDEEYILTLLSEILKSQGYSVSVCREGAAAIHLYREAFQRGEAFAAVIMDLTVPGGVGGKDAARGILAIDSKAHLIVSSGYSEDPVVSEMKQFGFCAAITKPYHAQAVLEVIEKVITSR